MSVAPSMTWPLVAISPSLRMKKPVPIPRTGVSTGPLPPCPYMRSRKSRNGSLPPARAVVATMPTTAGIDVFTKAAMEEGGAVGRSRVAGASIHSTFDASSSARASVMRARVGTPARCGNRSRLLSDHRSDELFGGVVRGARRPSAVEEHPEFVLGARLLRRPAPHFDVSEELRHHLAGALRIAF